jgi:hypothetical protein
VIRVTECSLRIRNATEKPAWQNGHQGESMSTAHAKDFSAHEIGFPESARNTAASANEDFYMSRSTRKIVYMFLLGGAVLLASVATYVWYGFFQWQNLP